MTVTIFLLDALLSLICDRPIYSLCRFLVSSAIARCVILYFFCLSACLSVCFLSYMDLCCLIQIKCMYVQGGPAKVKPTYFTHQNSQTCYYSTVLFYKKTGSYSQKYYKRKG